MCTKKFLPLLVLCCALFVGSVENRAVFDIGMRIINDQLLVKDLLRSSPTGVNEHPQIKFNYAIPEPITYFEISAEENVLAEVNFRYHNDLVEGTVTSISTNGTSPTAFEIKIAIYGFNQTMSEVDKSLVINRDTQFDGILHPNIGDEPDDGTKEFGLGLDLDQDGDDDYEIDDEYESMNLSDSPGQPFEGTAGDEDDDGIDGLASAIDLNEDDFAHTDKTIEVGRRQAGDYLIYTTHQTSPMLTQEPTNHSAVFYYIDSDFITFVKFVIFDHYVGRSDKDYKPPVAEYSHFTPHTLKAVVTDYDTTSLFVQMTLFGYSREDVPIDYEPYLKPTHPEVSDVSTDSPLQRLRKLMKFQHQNDAGDVQKQQTPETEATPNEDNQKSPQTADADDGATACFYNPAILLMIAVTSLIHIVHA